MRSHDARKGTDEAVEIHASDVAQLLCYEEATGLLLWKFRQGAAKDWNTKYAGKVAGCLDGQGYRTIRINGRQYLAHRLVWAIHHKQWPDGPLDHIDRNKSNNRLTNLRRCSVSENQANTGPQANNTSGIKGVFWHSAAKKWAAAISVSGRRINLGVFKEKQDAAAAYDRAALEHFGEFAVSASRAA